MNKINLELLLNLYLNYFNYLLNYINIKLTIDNLILK